MSSLRCGRFQLDAESPKIMAIVNVTPDSFSGDGVGNDVDRAVRRAQRAVADGADIIDIGGESTRPGAESVSVEEELDRVMPVLERLVDGPVPVSVDTQKPEVMRAAISAGASMINDVGGFCVEGVVDAVKDSDVALCVMHMQGDPGTMQLRPGYKDVVVEVSDFLDSRAAALCKAGVSPDRIVLDPGFGFGKTVEHNLELLNSLKRFGIGGYPILVGLSRKSLVGALTGRPPGERVFGSVACALLALERGARILRVHDVAPTRDAVNVWTALANVS